MWFDSGMARTAKPSLKEQELRGFRYFRLVDEYLDRLHNVGCRRDRAGNRQLHMDQYARLVLLFLFNPQCDSLHAIQQASLLRKVQRRLGVPPTSMGSLSESVHLFGAEQVEGLIDELLGRLPRLAQPQPIADLDRIVTAVDGTLLKNLPKVVQALWTDNDHPAYKAHVQLEVFDSRPTAVCLTDGRGNEKAVLEDMLEAGRLYLLDRGYFKYALFQAILEAGSSFCCRLQEQATLEILEERELSEDALGAGVVRDAFVNMGVRQNKTIMGRPLRIVTVERVEQGRSYRNPCRRVRAKETLTVVTDRLDLPPETIAWLYSLRWEIETFFRFFKKTLGCDHLLSHNENGVRLQVYLAIIACLLMALFVGTKPDKNTRRMLHWYLSGLAEKDEFETFLSRRKPARS